MDSLFMKNIDISVEAIWIIRL